MLLLLFVGAGEAAERVQNRGNILDGFAPVTFSPPHVASGEFGPVTVSIPNIPMVGGPITQEVV